MKCVVLHACGFADCSILWCVQWIVRPCRWQLVRRRLCACAGVVRMACSTGMQARQADGAVYVQCVQTCLRAAAVPLPATGAAGWSCSSAAGFSYCCGVANLVQSFQNRVHMALPWLTPCRISSPPWVLTHSGVFVCKTALVTTERLLSMQCCTCCDGWHDLGAATFALSEFVWWQKWVFRYHEL